MAKTYSFVAWQLCEEDTAEDDVQRALAEAQWRGKGGPRPWPVHKPKKVSGQGNWQHPVVSSRWRKGDRSVIRQIWIGHLLRTGASSPALRHVPLGEDGEEKENKPANLQVLPLGVHSRVMHRRVGLKGTPA